MFSTLASAHSSSFSLSPSFVFPFFLFPFFLFSFSVFPVLFSIVFSVSFLSVFSFSVSVLQSALRPWRRRRLSQCAGGLAAFAALVTADCPPGATAFHSANVDCSATHGSNNLGL